MRGIRALRRAGSVAYIERGRLYHNSWFHGTSFLVRPDFVPELALAITENYASLRTADGKTVIR